MIIWVRTNENFLFNSLDMDETRVKQKPYVKQVMMSETQIGGHRIIWWFCNCQKQDMKMNHKSIAVITVAVKNDLLHMA